MTRDDIAAVMECEPLLGHFGIGVFDDHRKDPNQRRADLERDRAELLADVDGCTRAERWLLEQAKTRTINPRWSSYGLKHIAESATGGHIANGSFIAAAIHLGFAYKLHPGSPNVGIGISERSLKGKN